MARLKGLRWDKRRGLWRWPAEWDRPSLRPSVPLTTPTPTTPAGFRSLVGVRRMGTAGSTGYTLALDPARLGYVFVAEGAVTVNGQDVYFKPTEFDLLLFLVKKDDLDIHNIPISHITTEYLSYLELMKDMNLDVAGHYSRPDAFEFGVRRTTERG